MALNLNFTGIVYSDGTGNAVLTGTSDLFGPVSIKINAIQNLLTNASAITGTVTDVPGSGGGGIIAGLRPLIFGGFEDGEDGLPGIQGQQGIQGVPGDSVSIWPYRAYTGATSGYPGDGNVEWNNAAQISSTHIYISHLTQNPPGQDIDIIFSLLASGQDLIIQDANDSSNYQKWVISGTPTNINPNTATSYWDLPVTLISSGGTGTTNFPNNHEIFIAVIRAGAAGPTGPQGPAGVSGLIPIDGEDGLDGIPGAAGIAGAAGAAGAIGPAGMAGLIPVDGEDGQDGMIGSAGAAGASAGGGMTKIQKIVTSGSASTITFSGIPGSYTDLLITFLGRLTSTTTITTVNLQFNGDTTSGNYVGGQFLSGSAGSVASATVASASTGLTVFNIVGTSLATHPLINGKVTIPAYSQTVLMKGFHSEEHIVRNASDGPQVIYFGGEWISTAAITSIVLTTVAGTFLDGTTATLYGLG